MDPERHERAAKIFREAIGLDPGQREAFLERECAGEDALRGEVASLLAHHRTGTILDQPPGQARPPRRRERRPLLPFLIPSAILLLLLVVGFNVRRSIQRSLRAVVGQSLRTVLDADVLALRLWIEQELAEARAWAEDPGVAERVSELSSIGRADELDAAPAGRRLGEALRPFLLEKGCAAFSLVDRSGLVLAASLEDGVGRRLSAGAMRRLTEVFLGEARFVAPLPPRLRVYEPDPTEMRPMVWFGAPVAGEGGEVVAVLGLARYADGQFTRIVGVGRLGETGEAYAIDDDGRLLTGNPASILEVQVREPGGTLTRAVALAVASRNEEDTERQQGVIQDRYRNRHGIEVKGAWTWLPEHGFGVVTEVEVDEVYAPLRYLDLVFDVLLVLLVLSLLVTWITVLTLARLRRHIRRLGPYTLLEKIGEGGMGEVHLARHALLKRPTAVKVLREEVVSDETLARFEREVQLASQLTHPNTIEIYDFGRTPSGVLYYAMEFLTGRNLSELVAEAGALPATRTIHVLMQIGASLREAHARGLIHRDIKPNNIMLCARAEEYDVVKVLDFGLAKSLDRGDDQITGPLRITGTPLYMAPERLKDRHSLDARSDLYSLGAVGYFLLTGVHAFEADSEVDVVQRVLGTMPSRPSEAVGHTVPAELEDLLLRCLAKEPADRPRDVTEFLDALRPLRDSAPWSRDEAAAWWREHPA